MTATEITRNRIAYRHECRWHMPAINDAGLRNPKHNAAAQLPDGAASAAPSVPFLHATPTSPEARHDHDR